MKFCSRSTFKMEQSKTSSATPSLKRKNPTTNQPANPNKKLRPNLPENTPTINLSVNVQNFRQIPIIPTIDELKNKNDPFLMENIIEGSFKNVDHYLEVQFRLLREDFLGPLRQKITNFLPKTEHDNHSSIFQYDDVRICDFEISQDGIIYRLQFDREKFESETFENSTRLAFGSLLCLSCDNFDTALFATVADKNQKDLKKGVIKVRFETELNSNHRRRYTILESQAFFEAYRHVLKGLQSFNSDILPLQKYLVDVEPKLEPPMYVKKKPTFYLKLNETNEDGERTESAVQVLDVNTWPTPEALNLDEFQRRAMHLALSSSLAIIQGPPGTGKTHVGLKIVEAILYNLRATRCGNRCDPILVVCFTNHALDQFLEGIIKFTNRVVRFGSRCNSEALAPFTLRALHGKSSRSKREILNLKHQRAEAEKKLQTERNRSKFVRTRVIHETLLEKSLKDDDLKLVKSLRVKVDGEPPSSFLGAWLGVITSELVSEENLQKFTGSKIPKEKIKVSDDRSVKPDEKPTENGGLNVYNAKNGKRVTRTRFVIHDWAVVVDVGKECEKLVANEHAPLLSKLGKLCALVVKMEFWKEEEMADVEIKREKDAWKFDLAARWRLYRRWRRMFKEAQDELVESCVVDYKKIAAKLRKEQNSELIEILAACEVVGMTTTCAARLLEVLREVGPKIVIVEEAAEVLESHITTCMSKSTQQLILIGDHQQLRPSVNVHELARKYKLDVSLFERMIKNKIPFETLQLQHRMRPEISSLLVPHIYASLLDHPAVLKYPNVKGVSQNVFFLDHDIPEESPGASTSHANRYEAEFLVTFCEYLLQQGYKPSQITILTPYSGQLGLVRKFAAAKTFEGVHVTVVDNFQGEESDIILLSFARSNETDHIGFLKVHNRINVALSRAKIGLFCVGNFRHFARRSHLWRAIVADLEKRKHIGPAITLACQTHACPSVVRNAHEIKSKCPRGGCLYKCGVKLKCGHLCKQYCHVDEHTKCEQTCDKILCENQHKCPLKCFEECQRCDIVVRKKHAACEHTLEVACSVDVDAVKCMRRVVKTLDCGHRMELYCCTDPTEVDYCEEWCNLTLECGHVYGKKCNDPNIDCKTTVQKALPCGHSAVLECSTDVSKLVCRLDCDRIPACGHRCKKECFEECGRCEEIVEKELECGHKYSLKCCVDATKYKCDAACARKLGCGHGCAKICWEKCGDCEVVVEKCLPCGHGASMMCRVDVRGFFCNFPCLRTLNCGHYCKRKCGEACKECLEMVETQLGCGHVTLLQCGSDTEAFVCVFPCLKLLDCGHKCTKMCREECSACVEMVAKKLPCGHVDLMTCCTDVVNVTCVAPCLKTLACGHLCDMKCSEKCRDVCERPVRVTSVCGHDVEVPCFMRSAPPQIVASYCGEPCNTFLPCEHNCGGTCGKCRQGRVHVSCESKCNRKQICGHVCFASCSNPCYPCGRVFTYLCDHIRDLKCGSRYVKCEEECTWVCSHYKCTRKCWELCDRPRCDEPCQLKLHCGHACSGLCGEKCPKLCKVCDNFRSLEAFFCDAEVEDARFIELNECGHSIEVGGLDRLMEADESSVVGLKSCPKCGAAIGRSHRYGNIIKQQIGDIEKVKSKFSTRWSEHIRRKRELGIASTKLDGDYFPVVRALQDRLVANERLIGPGLVSMVNQVKVLKLMADMKRNSESFEHSPAKRFIGDEIDWFLKRVTEMEDKINEWDWRNIVRELKRSELIAIYKNAEAVLDDVIDFESTNEMERVRKVLEKTLPFNDGDERDVTRALEYVHRVNAIDLAFSKVEDLCVSNSKDPYYGHWYKCSSGHVYFCADKFYADHQERCGECA